METILSTLVGVGVSIGLFLLGYRQTIGAKRERVHAANLELERILLKRIVLESYEPSLIELSTLISGKARDYRVQPSDLLSEHAILATVFTRVLESDFITPDKREEITRRLAPLWPETEDVVEADYEVVPSTRPHFFLPLMSAVLASVMGAALTAAPLFNELLVSNGRFAFSEFIGRGPVVAFVVSLAAVFSIALVLQFRERLEKPSGDLRKTRNELELEVAQRMRGAGFTIEVPDRPFGLDFIAVSPNRRIAVEVRQWLPETPPSRIASVQSALVRAMERVGATEALLISGGLPDVIADVRSDPRCRVLKIDELNRVLLAP